MLPISDFISLRRNPLRAAFAILLGAGGISAASGAESEAASGFHPGYEAEAIMAAGSNEFAPYYIMSNNHGILSQSKDALLRLSLKQDWDTTRRFSYGFGAEVIGGYASATDYLRFYPDATANGIPGAIDVTNGALLPHSERPAAFWLQQLYGELRYRGVFMTVGLKAHRSALLNFALSSGDLVESGNSRPIPEVRVGFNDFQNIPFTNGWVQIQGELSYGKLTDNKWLRNHYNYYDAHLNQGALYTYKRCYFRTKPSMPLSVTVGLQVGGFFGGQTTSYAQGKVYREKTFSKGIKQFFKMLVPSDGGGQAYYSGSSLGSWDLMFRYRLKDGSTLKAYLQKPWEDGSGIGWLNGFDGLWGLEFRPANPGLISAVVVEYLDFTNQGGPIHWDPDDVPGTDITTRAEGCDNYYYNHEYNAYAYYGMAIGTPFMVSPIYNTDGYLQFAANRLRGFHVGLEGQLTREISWRLLGGYRKSWGGGSVPFVTPKEDISVMVEGIWTPRDVEGLKVKAQFGLDHGSLLGNNTGAMVSVSYSGNLSFRK